MSLMEEMERTVPVLDAVLMERRRQDAKWGPLQDHPNILSGYGYNISPADYYKQITDLRAKAGHVSYTDILLEEVAEAVDEARAGDIDALRTELIQVAAVAVKWVELLDIRAAQ